ncbi:protein CYPRO4 [Physcomitrium patens]|nr:protein CYPRO4-like [Physcomitrium patens]XP_024395194.1 protein CYPRO4-like [Physcomitrium patens]XP_024395195.1 protein CYPRO4-like [Physcomitrium patens]XP_024395196.1 protein CYPRO4-like [Physcomitrium patens]PNR40713.1 hypothetical protein PHYPA_018116 [Physcomitrium patens]|eukprot:XP_024395193.1 protein CYPRO4-like [Physcomitrella patens]
MGTTASRDGRLESDSEDDGLDSPQSPSSERSFHDSEVGTPAPAPRRDSSDFSTPDATISLRMGSLTLDGPASVSGLRKAKLYQYIQGKWLTAAKSVGWQFVKEEDGDDEEDEEDEEWRSSTVGHKNYSFWMFEVGGARARVDDRLQMHFYEDQMRVDFVAKGVWALKFPIKEQFRACSIEYEDAKFENTYFLEPTEANKVKVFGKDFLGWVSGKEEDDSVWMDAEDVIPTPSKTKELRETLKTPSKTAIQSLAMGGMDHSFLVNDYGLDVLTNRSTGLEGTGITIRFQDGGRPVIGSSAFRTPKKGMLIRGESNMMLISPSKDGKANAGGVSQLDIGTGKMVAEWKFEKDGTPISMMDVTNDSKGAQLYSNGSTFLGLDNNRLCRWDMRDSQGIVQQLASPAALTWTEGHQFSRGTNFSCFATSGDGSVVVGSKDGKVRLYSTTSMRMAKTAFPGLGSPITHVDVTYDGKWVLATTDTYLILISTVFRDKDGRMKTGFSGRMGGKIGAPRLLKLRAFDAHRDGKQQKLHGGKFSWVTEEGKQERYLVVSAGTFTVVWNFDIVKDSTHDCYKHQTGLKSCYCYEVVAKPESIVQSTFMHEKFLDDSGEAPLVVATRQELSSFNL